MNKYFYSILFLVYLSFINVHSQNYPVTFQVDMSQVGSINPGVCVVGSFQLVAGYSFDWAPGITNLSDANNDSIYEITVSVPAGPYEYKFLNGGAWGNDEAVPSGCEVNNNRYVNVTGPTIIPVVCFGECSECIQPVIMRQVMFRVDMKMEGTINSPVSVVGNFQDEAGFAGDWQPGVTIMTDIDADSIYEVNVTLPQGNYEYKFVNGGSWGYDELVPSPCEVNNNRNLLLLSDTILAPICFGSCYLCVSTASLMQHPSESLKIFPNPATSNINWNVINGLAKMEAEIIDALGNVIIREINVTNNLNISSLSPGVYTLRLSFNNHSLYYSKICKIAE